MGILLLISCSGPEAKKMKFFGKGKELYEKGELVKAKLEFKNAVQIDPKFADAFRMLGMIALKEGDIKAAYGNFSKTVELDPGNRDAQYQLGKIFLGVRETDKAMEKAELLLRQDPKNADALQLKGAVMVARKDFDKARLYLEGLIGQGIKTPDVFLLLATTEAASGNAKGSESAVRRGIEANPRSVALNLDPGGDLRKGKTDRRSGRHSAEGKRNRAGQCRPQAEPGGALLGYRQGTGGG